MEFEFACIGCVYNYKILGLKFKLQALRLDIKLFQINNRKGYDIFINIAEKFQLLQNLDEHHPPTLALALLHSIKKKSATIDIFCGKE